MMRDSSDHHEPQEERSIRPDVDERTATSPNAFETTTRPTRERDRRDDRKRKKEREKSSKKHKKRRSSSESDSDSSASSSCSRSSPTSSDTSDDRRKKKSKRSSHHRKSTADTGSGGKKKTKVVNERLLTKLDARGETLEERRERRNQQRGAYIAAKFGYTADENPFRDPNLHETFTWKKRDEQEQKQKHARDRKESGHSDPKKRKMDTVLEIEKVRQRRRDRELQFQEMERIRAEESRMKELENYDEWARKEEEFHLQQQRQRSAIRLVEGREKPVDVLAKNVLLFGLSEQQQARRGSIKYQEKYNAMDALEKLEAELEEPHHLLRALKLNELQELLIDIDAFRILEREASQSITLSEQSNNTNDNPIIRYWDNLRVVAEDEIKFLKSGGARGSHARVVAEIEKIFQGQSREDLERMRSDIYVKLAGDGTARDDEDQTDRAYWTAVAEQLAVHLAKADLSELHAQMLVRQLERLEKKREELAQTPHDELPDEVADNEPSNEANAAVPDNINEELGDLEEELGLSDEFVLQSKAYSWEDKYRPRKPRYFNRVKTGYDWNRYNQTHYDKDNPPPKTVQGYKFNIFYPDLIDMTKTPQYYLEPADTDEFSIIRFRAGPPYEDLAFKIINREWNRSRKQGFKCTFERGVLSLYFNFKAYRYRR